MRAQIEALKAATGRLPRGLAEHVERVAAEADRLAAGFKELDRERVELAAWGHDIARALSPQELLARARGFGLEVNPVEEEAPILLHGPVGAEILRQEHGPLLSHMFQVAKRVAQKEGIANRGYRLTINVGEQGGQLIYHIHMHVLGGRRMGPEG